MRPNQPLNQQFIVENRPGAGGTMGFEGGRSLADSYTLTLAFSCYTINPSIYKLRFDPVADIRPIIQISQGPLLVAVNPSLPVKNIEGLVALATAKPGSPATRLSCGMG